MADDRLCLLSVHAHPDDEASKGAATVARYHAEGVRTVLVTCTGGEAGDILNPAMDRPEVRADLPAIRLRELARATEIIGYDTVELAGDPEWYPEAGEPWQPLKLYYSVWSRRRTELAHKRFAELGLESPYSDEWFQRPSQEHRITTTVDVTGFVAARLDALLAHETQIDPTSKWWFGLPRDEELALYPYEDYILARSRVPASNPETDLFAGIRQSY
jgi:LmbE family N-acetylglucosaminyl deacetylase